MKFDLAKSISILERTPAVLKTYLTGLSSGWTLHNEGENTWSPFDILGHLILGDKTDWIIRAEIILSTNINKKFTPFDMVGHFENSKGKSMEDLLEEFAFLRAENIEKLRAMQISAEKLTMTGIHPDLGKVSLQDLLATWVAHDLGHISQISRVMAKQFKNEVGPWKPYLGILNK